MQTINFLDASSHLYKRVCPSVRMSVRTLVRKQLFVINEFHHSHGITYAKARGPSVQSPTNTTTTTTTTSTSSFTTTKDASLFLLELVLHRSPLTQFLSPQRLIQMPFDDGMTSSLSLDDGDDFYSVYGAHARHSSRRSIAPSIAGTSELDASICSGVSSTTAASSTWHPSSDRASSVGSDWTRHGGGGVAGSGAVAPSVIDPAMLINARISVLTFVLTHETPSSIPSAPLTIVERLTRMAEGYFEAIAGVNCALPVEEFASELTKACAGVGGGDHLRLTVKPVNATVREKAGTKTNLVCRNVDVTLGSLDIVECLFEETVRERRGLKECEGGTFVVWLVAI